MKIYDKNLNFDEWSRNPTFSLEAYDFKGEAVLCRGSNFECGDILLTNQASDSDGLFSTLLEGEVSFAHVALFAVLERSGKLFPAVIEMNEQGVRAVPLKAFLSDRFSTYVEIFRHLQPLTSTQKSAISRAAIEIIGEPHAFDIYQDAAQNYYLNCARTVDEVLRRAGVESVQPGSFYDLRTRPNLEVLGIEKSAGQPLLMPEDFANSPHLSIVGVIDNGQFDALLARALMRDRIQELWRTENLDRSRFPFSYVLNRLFVVGIQKQAWYSPLLLRLIGVSRAEFPSGPAVFLSLAAASNHRMERGARQLQADLKSYSDRIDRLKSWREIKEDPQIKTLVACAAGAFQALYRGKRQNFALFKKPKVVSPRVSAGFERVTE